MKKDTSDLLKQFQNKPFHIRVYHDRAYDPDGNVLGKGGTTTVVLSDKDRQDVAVATAYCSPKDNFNRRVGRNVAIGRAMKAIREGVNTVYVDGRPLVRPLGDKTQEAILWG